MEFVAIAAVKDMPLHVLERYVDCYNHTGCCSSIEPHDTDFKNCMYTSYLNIKQP